VAIVLAAGSAVRFGSPKQLALLGGIPLVAHTVRAAHAAGVTDVLVVVGQEAAAVAEAARQGGPIVAVHNPDHAAGQSTSLRAGIEAATDLEGEVAVMLLADQPSVAPEAIRAVVGAVTGPAEGARARYDDGAGHPVAFARRVWPRVAAVTGDRGARDLLEELAIVDVAIAGPVPPDVDVPSDLPSDPPGRPPSDRSSGPPSDQSAVPPRSGGQGRPRERD
jgi:molybdenum cofactor cytidylyltransferase